MREEGREGGKEGGREGGMHIDGWIYMCAAIL